MIYALIIDIGSDMLGVIRVHKWNPDTKESKWTGTMHTGIDKDRLKPTIKSYIDYYGPDTRVFIKINGRLVEQDKAII